MKFEVDEEQYDFVAVLRDALVRHAGAKSVRGLWDSPSEDLRDLTQATTELGVAGLTVHANHGGAGLAVSDCVLVLEELGAHLVPHPFAETLAVAAPILERHLEPALSDQMLRDISNARLLVTLQDDWSGWAPWAAQAGLVAVITADAVVLTKPTKGDIEGIHGIDPARKIGRIKESAPRVAVLGLAAAQEARQRSTVMAANVLSGLSRGMLESAVDYAQTRMQFGRTIGSFQAVKHLLAEAFTAVEASRRTAWWAWLSLEAQGDDQPEAVAVAKALIGEAAMKASYAALQVHGGLGYTWDCDLHLWMKRVQAVEASWGGSTEQWSLLERLYLASK